MIGHGFAAKGAPVPKQSADEENKPTIAVALRYDGGKKETPRVVASGRGAIAERILELAFQHGIKVREDADLAEILEAVEVGDEIPVAAFAAVAEILIYIYRANRALVSKGLTP
jgi:flagellar biosynthesis protein